MPTIRINSSSRDYHRLPPDVRLTISVQLHDETCRVLDQTNRGVDAFWLAPFDQSCAVNTLNYTVDVEFSSLVGQDKLEQLAKALLQVFRQMPYIHTGESYGIWIKTPYAYLWKEEEKGTIAVE